MAAIDLIIGAALSGIIGIVTYEYQRRRREIIRQKEWYEEAIRLSQRVTKSASALPIDEEGLNQDDFREIVQSRENIFEFEDEAEHVRDVFRHVYETLNRHIESAPPDASPQAIEAAHNLASNCFKARQEYTATTLGDDDTFSQTKSQLPRYVGPALVSAKKLEKISRLEKAEIRILCRGRHN